MIQFYYSNYQIGSKIINLLELEMIEVINEKKIKNIRF